MFKTAKMDSEMGDVTALRSMLQRNGLNADSDYVVYLTAEWLAPVDAVVLPHLAETVRETEPLVVVQRGDFTIRGFKDDGSIRCDEAEFRELCCTLQVDRLPMCVLLTKLDQDESIAPSNAVKEFVATMRSTSDVSTWLPLPIDCAPLATDAPTLVELRERATALFEQGDFGAGATMFTRALLHCPTCPKANFNMSVILQMMGEMAFAVDHMLRVVAVDDQDAVAHTVLRTVLYPAEPNLVIAGYESILSSHAHHVRAAHSLATLRGEATTAAPDYVRQVFDHLAETFEEKLVTHLEYRVPWQIVDALQRADALPMARTNRLFSAIDLGCGTGLCGRLLRPFASHIAGIDLSPLMVEKTRETGYYDELANIIPFLDAKPDESLDLVVSADVWIYVGALDEIFPMVKKKLQAEGWFSFSTEYLPSSEGFQLASSGRFKHSDAYISNLAAQHGFTIRIHDEITVRKESSEPIPGRIYVLQRSS